MLDTIADFCVCLIFRACRVRYEEEPRRRRRLTFNR